jgi:hypothetical protein
MIQKPARDHSKIAASQRMDLCLGHQDGKDVCRAGVKIDCRGRKIYRPRPTDGPVHRRERPSSAKTRFAECSMSQSRRRPRAAAQTTALFIIIGVYSSAPKTDVLRDINGLPNVRPHGSVNTAPSGRIHSCTWHISVEAGGCKGRTTRCARPDWGTLGDSPKLPAPSSRVPSCLILKNKRPRLPTL